MTFVWAALAAVLGLLVAPPADAQEPGKVSRVGVLGTRSSAESAALLTAFVEGLRELGWVEGKNVAIEYRFAHG